jgi:hypothetical protein
MESISENFHSILYLNDRYNLLPSLSSKFPSYNEDYSKEVLKYLKEVIKSKKTSPTVKLQALKLLNSLMSSKNVFIIEYCGKKFFNRFKIFAEHRKESKDERRGTLLFQAEGRSNQVASEEFLILLLKSVKIWAKNHPLDSRGKPSAFSKLFSYLQSKGVTFPEEGQKKEKEELKSVLIRIRKNVKSMFDFISENRGFDKIKKIGKTLETSNQMIQNQIVKYMDMEDHDLIKDLNLTLDLLNDGNNAFHAWQERTARVSILDNPQFTLPPSCLFLPDIEPKELPGADELSASIGLIQVEESSPGPLITEREFETEKEFTLSNEWTGLGADYCRLKDRLEITEQNALSYQIELEKTQVLYERELAEKEVFSQMAEEMKIKWKAEKKERENEKMRLLMENEELRKFEQDYKKNIRKLEEELEKITQNHQNCLILIEKLEKEKNFLDNNCKQLEQETEKLQETERNMKKDLKDLNKQLNKLKQTSKSSPASPRKSRILQNEEFLKLTDSNENLEEISVPEDSPSKIRMFSIISQEDQSLIPCQEDPLPESQAENLSFDSLTSEGFSLAHEPTNKLTHIDNIENFKEVIRKKHGVLYENLLIQVTSSMQVSDFQGKLRINLKNMTDQNLNQVKTKLFFDPNDQMFLAINSEGPETISQGQILEKSVIFKCKGIFQVFPLMKITFFYENEKNTIVLLLPISYTLFFLKSQIDLIKEWENIEECVETVVKCEHESIKKLAKSLVFSRNFQYSYIEGNGVILAGNSPVGVVLAVVSLAEQQASIQVKCLDLKVRDLISSMIITQVAPTSFDIHNN